MKKLVKFNFETNVISGGIRLKPNFLKSVDVINGAVLRAAFANDILIDCPFAEEITEGKKYQVLYRGEKCGNCEHKNICKNFSDMKFSFLRPEGTIPAPFTARTCKAHGTDHCVMDIIMKSGTIQCTVPECKGRMENLKGIIKADTFQSVSIPHSISTHTAIEPCTRTAKNECLFSIESIKNNRIYECEIDDCDSGMLYEGKVIYIGKYSSSGFGKIRIVSVEDIRECNVRERIRVFNEKTDNKAADLQYAAILLLSDAKLDIDKYADGIKTNDEYKSIWKRAFFGEDSCFNIEQVYAQNYYYNGFDTSVPDEDRQHSSEYLTEMGTSVLVSFKEGDEEALCALEKLSQNGIGRDTECGYGQISICSDIHMTGIKEDQ